MIKAPLPLNEPARLAALRSYEILDTPPEESFDDLAKLAAHICAAPVALISLVDENRQWFKARLGFEPEEIARDGSFCSHGILQDELLIVPDATQDERFEDNPFVTAGQVLFYAAAPLISADGQALGMICVTDTQPRKLMSSQMDALNLLAGQVVALLELRKRNQELQAEILGRRLSTANVEDISRGREEEEQLQKLSLATKMSGVGVWELKVHDFKVTWDETMFKIYGLPRETVINHELWKNAVWTEDLAEAEAALQQVISEKGRGEMEFRIRRPNGSVRHIQAAIGVTLDQDQNVTRVIGINRDVTEDRRRDDERDKVIAELQELLMQIKTLSGLIPICGWCKSVRSDTGYWQSVEQYVRANSAATFSHGICPNCSANFKEEIAKANAGAKDPLAGA